MSGDRYASFSVTVSGSPSSYTYQWYKKRSDGTWQMLSAQEAKGSTYTTKDSGSYHCMVTEIHPPMTQQTSRDARLRVHDVPFISGIIAPEVCNGSDLVATAVNVVANGSDLTQYRWFLPDTTLQSGAPSNNTVPDLVYQNAKNTRNGQILSLTVTNGCGSTTISNVPLTIWATPPLPTPKAISYCQGAAAEPMSSGVSTAVWYDAPTGGSVIPEAPVPDTSIPGTQTWWVSQKTTYNNNLSCESGRVPATATILPLPAPPDFTPETTLCLNDPSITLTATGTGVIKWYDFRKTALPAAPQINTSTAGGQTYYVTQTIGDCESPVDNGKITVLIRDRATVEDLKLSYASLLCPNTSTVIEATSQKPNSTFRWYTHNNKTGLVHTGPTFTTPVLTRDTVYYVTLQYTNYCESDNSNVSITVKDDKLPTITAPPAVEVGTNDGVCYATNVDTGQPRVADNCTQMSNLVVYTDPVAPSTYPLGYTTLIWWVRDETGNMDKAEQTISVKDREKPKGSCPADIIREVDEDVDSTIVTYNLNYTDNCSPVKYQLKDGKPTGSYFKLGTTAVRYEITDSAGNTETCAFNIIVRHPYRPMEVTLRPNAYEICPGEKVVITPVISGGSGTFVYSWKQPVRTVAVMEDYPLESTTYELTVNDGITTQTKTVHVEVLVIQQVTLTLEGRPMDELFEGDEILVSATPGFASYELLLDNKVVQAAGLNNLVSFQASKSGTYFVRVFATDVNFCVSQDQLQIEVDSKKLPNVFTPNRDGKNDLYLEGFDLQVFSRAGELLYKGTTGWDGTYKGKLLPQGTYLYVVKRTMNNGEQRVFKGTVTLKL